MKQMYRFWNYNKNQMLEFDIKEVGRIDLEAYGNLMQTSGISDVDGTDVYEYDILSIQQNSEDDVGDIHLQTNYGLVQYYEDLAGFVIRKGSSTSYVGLLSESGARIKVEGNIFETPKLLEKTEIPVFTLSKILQPTIY